MKFVPFSPIRYLILTALTAAVPLTSAAPATAKVRIVPYGKAGVWSVRAVFRADGPFDHCSASARYKSGTRVSIIAYRSGNWRIWFAHSSWPDRGRTTFPAKLQVDGRTVLQQQGHYKGRNAYLDLGRNVDRVKALMRGRQMAVVTSAGTSRFSLNGTFRATVQVARCWKANYKSPASGAFGSANKSSGGAFGGGGAASSGGAFGGAAPKPRANELTRANTLELATQYLSKSQKPYSILPANKNTLKHFPVNWKYGNGDIGGMRVFKNTRTDVEKLLAILLSDQAKYCTGRNASQRETVRNINGRRMIRARGVCETNKGSILNITYKVAELGRAMVMMVMEVEAKSGSGQGAGAGKDSRTSGGDPIRVPGPNEL